MTHNCLINDPMGVTDGRSLKLVSFACIDIKNLELNYVHLSKVKYRRKDFLKEFP